MWNSWTAFGQALFGTPRRALVTSVIIVVVVVTGLLKLIFAAVIVPLLTFIVVVFVIGVVLRIALGHGRREGGHK